MNKKPVLNTPKQQERLSEVTEDLLKSKDVAILEPKPQITHRSVPTLDDIKPGAEFYVVSPHKDEDENLVGGVRTERLIKIMRYTEGIYYLISRNPISDDIMSGENGQPYEQAMDDTWSMYIDKSVLRKTDDVEALHNLEWQKKHSDILQGVRDELAPELRRQRRKAQEEANKEDPGRELFKQMIELQEVQNEKLDKLIEVLTPKDHDLAKLTFTDAADAFRESIPPKNL